MGFTLTINGSRASESRYVGWTPSPCVLRVTGIDRLTTKVVRVSNKARAGGGKLVFYEKAVGPAKKTLKLNVAALGGSARFWVGGEFGNASRADRDTAIVVSRKPGAPAVLTVPCMVRVRKDANTLTSAERDRFLRAIAAANNQGNGVFQLVRDMHVQNALGEAHGNTGFLPWHRAYLLDLERELQAIDPSVTLPYWRFDAPAPNVFDPAFVGVANAQGTVQFTATNPLRFWVTDAVLGISRRPEFNTTTESARSTVPPPVRVAISEAATLATGQAAGSQYNAFVGMEGNPHGTAHVSFGGLISDPATAPRDPLFFMLHANVDRLWAKWQWLFDRFDVASASSFTDGNRVGHRRADTMWPWNGVVAPPRPPTAPGGGLLQSAVATAPGASPAVGQMIDYQGRRDPAFRLGFDYDDVPFEA
jgi:tyrosinase